MALSSSPVTKYLYKKDPVLSETLGTIMRLRGVRPSWPEYCVVLTVHILPHLMFYLTDMWGELYILSAVEQFFSTQFGCHYVL